MTDLSDLSIRHLRESDPPLIAAAFADMNKSCEQYERYGRENVAGTRVTLVALIAGDIVGYGNVVWRSDYIPFRDQAIPEIQDLNVATRFRRMGIASRLMDALESTVAQRSSVAGIGVGLHPGYGAAQRMYILRGYVPDAKPITYHNEFVREYQQLTLDDDLVLHLTKDLMLGSGAAPDSDAMRDPWLDDSAMPMDPPPNAVAGETDLFGLPVARDVFGEVVDNDTKKKRGR